MFRRREANHTSLDKLMEEGDNFAYQIFCDRCNHLLGVSYEEGRSANYCFWKGWIQGKRTDLASNKLWEHWCNECFERMERDFPMKTRKVDGKLIHEADEYYKVCDYCKDLLTTLPCSRCALRLVARDGIFDDRRERKDSHYLDCSGDKPICSKCWVSDPAQGEFLGPLASLPTFPSIQKDIKGFPVYDLEGSLWPQETDWRPWGSSILEFDRDHWVVHSFF